MEAADAHAPSEVVTIPSTGKNEEKKKGKRLNYYH